MRQRSMPQGSQGHQEVSQNQINNRRVFTRLEKYYTTNKHFTKKYFVCTIAGCSKQPNTLATKP